LAKFLLLVALVVVVYLLIRGNRRVESQQPPSSPAQWPPQSNPAARPDGAGEDMVRCTVCGVHLPRSESFISRGKFFCSDEHRRLGVERSTSA
jgi:uncharacterized protein